MDFFVYFYILVLLFIIFFYYRHHSFEKYHLQNDKASHCYGYSSYGWHGNKGSFKDMSSFSAKSAYSAFLESFLLTKVPEPYFSRIWDENQTVCLQGSKN